MNVLDIRDLADDWQAQLDEIDDELPEADIEMEKASISEPFIELCNGLGCDEDPDSLRSYGEMEEPMLIADDDFEEYARELAEDLGLRVDGWPNSYIDWERAADALRVDYTSVTYDGTDYLHRA